MAARARKTQEPSFEGALERLEEIVEHLEGGELGLEEALGAFEEGIALSRRCAGQLEEAERRVEVLTGETGESVPLETDGDA